jgi:uncharacterized protein
MQDKKWNDIEKKLWSIWFEIPVTNYERAKKFYETIFKINIFTEDFGNFKMGIFPHKEVGCALCFGQGYKPNQDGVLVYMNAEPDLEEVLNRVESAGGKVIREKNLISAEHGFMAVFSDSEGNRLALHSSK